MRRAGMVLLVVCVLALSSAHSVVGQSWKIAFNKVVDGQNQLFTINLDGTGLTQLTSGPEDDNNVAPCWSPGGQYLCFTSGRTGQGVLFTRDMATGVEQQVTTGNDDQSPHWSWAPGVNKVAYRREGWYVGQPDCGIRVRDMTTGEETLLVRGTDLGCPTWSPSGSLILYRRSPGGLYVVPAEGGTPWLAFPDSGQVYQSAWSPTGGQIVAAQPVAGEPWLYIAPINDETGIVDWGSRLQLPGTYTGSWPTWSPDGQYIAYETYYHVYDRKGKIISTVYQLWTTRADGQGTPVYLTDGRWPEWSPVLGQPPVADAGGPYAGEPGQPVTLDGTASYDPEGQLIGYSWDFGDGSDSGWLDPPVATANHNYAAPGVYGALLLVFDAAGLYGSDVATVTIAGVSTAMHVSGIDMAFGGASGKRKSVTATVYVVDGFGDPVAGAAVTGQWTWPGHSLAPKTLTTDATGCIVDWTGYLAGIGGQVLTYTVQSVVRDGWTYDSGANVETSDTYLVP